MVDSSLIDNGIALSKEVNESFWMTQEDLSFLFKNAPGSEKLFNVLHEADIDLGRRRLLPRIAVSSFLDAKLLNDLYLAFSADYGLNILENQASISRFKFVDISRFILDFYACGTNVVKVEMVKFLGEDGKTEEEFFLHLTDPIASFKSRKTAIDIARKTCIIFPFSKLSKAFMKSGTNELEVESRAFLKADVWKLFDRIIKEDKLE